MRTRDCYAGQASVEYVGTLAVLALALAAFGAWAIHHVRAPNAAPPPAVRIFDPVALIGAPAQPAPEGPGRVSRLVRRGIRIAGRGGRLAGRGWLAMRIGFADGVAVSVRSFVRDPVAALTDGTGLLAEVVRDPGGAGASVVRAAIDYAKELRALPPEEAYLRFMHDLGGLEADVAVSRGRGAARRALLKAIRRRLDQIPAAGHAR